MKKRYLGLALCLFFAIHSGATAFGAGDNNDMIGPGIKKSGEWKKNDAGWYYQARRKAPGFYPRSSVSKGRWPWGTLSRGDRVRPRIAAMEAAIRGRKAPCFFLLKPTSDEMFSAPKVSEGLPQV